MAHVARRLHSIQDAPPCGSSLSLHALPCCWLLSVLAKPVDPGGKWEGLRVLVHWGEVKDSSCSATNLAPIAGAFLSKLTTSWDAESFAARAVECWKSSSEHERVGVLWKAEQTKMYGCLVITLYHQTAFLCRSHKRFKMTSIQGNSIERPQDLKTPQSRHEKDSVWKPKVTSTEPSGVCPFCD